MKIFTFGDSWAAGAGLKKHENNFTYYLGKELGYETQNYGKSGSSLGQITHEFIRQHDKISSDDLVVVIIPPDTRWYTQNKGIIQSMQDYKSKEYKQFLKGKTGYWFLYHHSLFIHTIYNICKTKNISVILAHNYGELVFMRELGKLIPKDIFLDTTKSLTKLLGEKEWQDNYQLDINGPPAEHFVGDYFIKNDNHPNELGHKRISELLLKKYRKKYAHNKLTE